MDIHDKPQLAFYMYGKYFEFIRGELFITDLMNRRKYKITFLDFESQLLEYELVEQ